MCPNYARHTRENEGWRVASHIRPMKVLVVRQKQMEEIQNRVQVMKSNVPGTIISKDWVQENYFVLEVQ
jgi:hypothetical protein